MTLLNGGLIQCPDCEKTGKKQILGKMTQDGEFMVLRFHHGTTLVESQQYNIKCGCGWSMAVNQGTIVAQMNI